MCHVSCPAGNAPVCITQIDVDGVAQHAGLVVGDVIVRFNGDFVGELTQKELVARFGAAGSSQISLEVKTVRCKHFFFLSLVPLLFRLY